MKAQLANKKTISTLTTLMMRSSIRRVRQLIALFMIPALVFVPLMFGGRGFTPTAAAQLTIATPPPTPTPTPTTLTTGTIINVGGAVPTPTPLDLTGTIFDGYSIPDFTPPLGLIICGEGGTAGANRIIQKCPFYSAHSIALEEEVINELMAMYKLPPEDRGRLVRWERNMIRAALFDKIMGYINKAPETRTAREQFFVDRMAAYVKQKRVHAATAAQNEYYKWKSNFCNYAPPSGFTYTIPINCYNNLSSVSFLNPPPFEEFQNYGAAIAYREFKTNQQLIKISGETVRHYTLLAGFTAAVAAGAISAAIVSGLTMSSAVIAAIHPMMVGVLGAEMATATGFSFTAGGMSVAAATAEVGGTAVGGGMGALTVGGPVMVIIATIVIAVTTGIMVFTAEEIPGKLQEARNNAENAVIDMAQVASTDAGKQEIYSNFLLATMPDYPGASSEVPPIHNDDPRFVTSVDGTPGANSTPSFSYNDWLGLPHTVRMSGNWFVVSNDYGDDRSERLTLTLEYLDWEGRGWTVTRVGGKFLHTSALNPPLPPMVNDEIMLKQTRDITDTTDDIKLRVQLRRAQTITFANPGTKTFGDAPFTLNATASSNLPVSYAVLSGPATVSGSTLTITGAGSVTVEASQSGNDTYAAADAMKTFTVNKRATTMAVASSSNPSLFGQSVTFTATVTGMGAGAGNPTSGSVQFKIDGANVGSPVALSSSGTATFSTGGLTVNSGTAHTVGASYLGSDNFTASSGALSNGQTVNKALLLVTAQNKTGVYSDALSALTYMITGFVNGDTTNIITGTPALATKATVAGGNITSGAGNYEITPTLGSLSTANYLFNFASGTLTVAKETTQTDYTGDNYVTTAGPNVSTASGIRLAARLTQEADNALGDITLARARFELYRFNNTSTTPNYVFGNLAVNSSGNVETTVSLPADDAYTVRVVVESANGYWTANPVYDGTLTVALGSTEKRVSGGGWVTDDGSANKKGHFGFTVNYANNGSPKGNAMYSFRGADGFNYRVKSNSWQGGGLTFYQDAAKAAFSGNCNVQKSDPVTGAVVESWGNYSFTVDLVDGDVRNPRESDRYAIQILTNAGAVWRQVGSRTNPMQIGGGNVSVQSK